MAEIEQLRAENQKLSAERTGVKLDEQGSPSKPDPDLLLHDADFARRYKALELQELEKYTKYLCDELHISSLEGYDLFGSMYKDLRIRELYPQSEPPTEIEAAKMTLLFVDLLHFKNVIGQGNEQTWSELALTHVATERLQQRVEDWKTRLNKGEIGIDQLAVEEVTKIVGSIGLERIKSAVLETKFDPNRGNVLHYWGWFIPEISVP